MVSGVAGSGDFELRTVADVDRRGRNGGGTVCREAAGLEVSDHISRTWSHLSGCGASTEMPRVIVVYHAPRERSAYSRDVALEMIRLARNQLDELEGVLGKDQDG